MNKVLLLLFLLLSVGKVFSQGVAINEDGSSSDNSAILDIKSTTKGLLFPRMTTVQRDAISSPVEGLQIYNLTSGCVDYFNGTTWITANKHYVGELFGGGVVFWVDHTGQHGIIISMVDLSTSQEWSNVTNTEIGSTAQSDWDGDSNSSAIINQSGHTDSAAKLCDDYTNEDYGTGTFSDWYLPSITELNHLWNNFYEVQKALDSDGNSSTIVLTRTYHWSSSENNNSYGWAFGFSGGSVRNSNKGTSLYVRSVRYF